MSFEFSLKKAERSIISFAWVLVCGSADGLPPDIWRVKNDSSGCQTALGAPPLHLSDVGRGVSVSPVCNFTAICHSRPLLQLCCVEKRSQEFSLLFQAFSFFYYYYYLPSYLRQFHMSNLAISLERLSEKCAPLSPLLKWYALPSSVRRLPSSSHVGRLFTPLSAIIRIKWMDGMS